MVSLWVACAVGLALFLASASVGCGGESSSGTGGAGGGGTGGASACPNDLPDACPMPEPGYSKDVAPILLARCLDCHSPGGEAETTLLDDYAHVFARRTTVLTRVYGCKMPPAGAPALTDEQRATILGWLVCGAKDN